MELKFNYGKSISTDKNNQYGSSYSIYRMVNRTGSGNHLYTPVDGQDYNDFLGIDTPHPLVGVIDASKIKPLHHIRKSIGFYVIYLKDIKCADQIKYGRKFYDFQEETLVFAAPGQVIGNDDTGEPFQPKGWWLTFQPELLHGTPFEPSTCKITHSFPMPSTRHCISRSRKDRP